MKERISYIQKVTCIFKNENYVKLNSIHYLNEVHATNLQLNAGIHLIPCSTKY